ncbi:MAG: ferritin-like domain-containing protein [Nannocystaceae bacterium]
MNLTELRSRVDALNPAEVVRNAARTGNVKVTLSLLGPALRGLLLGGGRAGATDMDVQHRAHFDWHYARDRPDFHSLYEAAKRSQWNASTDLDWSIDVDPYDESRDLFPERLVPVAEIPAYRRSTPRERQTQRLGVAAWMLSNFLHGEQGALFAACQVTEAVEWMDGKLYGSTQVVDEGRHVEVFHRYIDQKLGKLYTVNDNLFTLIDALMSDGRWDIKFLGMQIMIEGLALGAFGILRQTTREPLLRELLRYVITDEARHVHYGVLALREHYARLPEKERREREDWAFEVATLMRNRFLAHEVYDEFYGHAMTRKEWDALLLRSKYMENFRRMMFRRLLPNLKRIHLLSDRVRPHYQALGLLEFESGKAAPDLSAADLVADSDMPYKH